jgi:lipoprotein-anchoring transpeptidase ErfK/SrfK
MRDNRENQKARLAKAVAVAAAIILLTPAKVFAQNEIANKVSSDVPAVKAQQSAPQAATSRAPIASQRQIPQREIVVSLPDKQLALLEDGKVLKTYTVAVGAEVSRSPEGDFTVINRLEKPTYYRPGKVIGPGKENPLGTRWMGLSKKGFGIHGTNEPSSIGKAASHGCIRMRQHDLEELFTLVRVGDKVLFRDAQMTALLAPVTQPADAPAVALNNSNALTVNATPTVVTSEEQQH